MLCVSSIVFFANPLTGCGDVNIINPGSEVDPDPVEDPATWRFPQSITDNISPDSTDAQSLDTAMDSSGNMILVWQQSDGTNDQIFKSEFRNGVWTHPSSLADNISPDGQSAQYPQVTMDNNGNAVIVWQQSDGTTAQIFKSEYRAGSWTHPSSLADNISPDGTHVTAMASVAMDNNGNTIIVWGQNDGANPQIFKSEYRSGAWTHPSALADNVSPAGSNAYNPQVAMSNNGAAIIAWHQHDGSKYQVFKSEYRSGSWTHPADLDDNISPDGTNVTMPSVAMDNDGNTIIVWAQNDGNSDQQTFKSEYRSGAWTHPSSLSDHISPVGGTGTNFWPYVSMNKEGTKAVIVWDQADTTYSRIYASVYENGAWTHPTDTSTDAISPDGSDAYIDFGSPVLVNDDGQVLIVWRQGDGTNDQVFMSEYR